MEQLNVVFTLFLGLAAIILIKKTQNKFIWVIIAVVSSLIADLLKTDYGSLGVLSIVSFYLFYNSLRRIIIAQTLLLLIFPYLIIFFEMHYHVILSSFYLDSPIEFLGLFSLFFIADYNKKEGYKFRYLFYLVYPLQYVVILFLKLFIK